MPLEVQTRAASTSAARQPASVPGGWLAAVVAALSALLVGVLLEQPVRPPSPEGRADSSRVAEVSPEDVPAALDTVAGTPRQLAQFRERDACSRRLAWVTIMRAPSQAPGRIRLRSGSYYSPVFDLGDAPVRVALPYPAPYETGRGVIVVVGATTPALVALAPPWHVPAQAGVEAREVTWTPVGACPSVKK